MPLKISTLSEKSKLDVMEHVERTQRLLQHHGTYHDMELEHSETDDLDVMFERSMLSEFLDPASVKDRKVGH